MYTTHRETAPQYDPDETPIGIKGASMTLSVLTIALTSICIDRFVRSVRAWKELPLPQYTLFSFYILSFLFSSVSAILKDLEPNRSPSLCDASILVCLLFYLSAKIVQYHYLVERAVSIRTPFRRLHTDFLSSTLFVPSGQLVCKTKFTSSTVFALFCHMWPWSFSISIGWSPRLGLRWSPPANQISPYRRLGYINTQGVCINGLEMQGIIPLLAFEILMNIYMTLLYVFPFRKILFKKQSLGPNSILQAMAYRTAIATCLMILVTVGNLIGLMALHGEPVWLCFICCSGDVAICVILLHWCVFHAFAIRIVERKEI